MLKYQWVVMKYDINPNQWICERCGEKLTAPMPCRLDTAVEMAKGFLKVHKKCKEGKQVVRI